MFKVNVGIAPEIMKDILQIDETPYNLRHKVLAKNSNVRSVNYGVHTIDLVATRTGYQKTNSIYIYIYIYVYIYIYIYIYMY